MSRRAAVVWTPDFLTHRFTPDHPLNPVRLDLTMRLAREPGVLEGVELLEPEPAPDAELERGHVSSYLEAVRAAPEKGEVTGTDGVDVAVLDTRRAVFPLHGL